MDPTQVAEIIKAAATRGWEAMLIAALMVSVVGFLAWLIRYWLQDARKREDELRAALAGQDGFTRGKLVELITQNRDALDRNSTVVSTLMDTLEKRPCLWAEDKQRKLESALAKHEVK